MVSGFTQVVAVIGHPITQVKSPENFNRYFAGQGQNSVMIPVDIVPEAVADYLNALRGWQNMSGVLVTVPHKQRVASLVDELTPRARHLNAVNVVRKLPDGRLQGDMLDGVGFLLAAKMRGFQACGKSAAVRLRRRRERHRMGPVRSGYHPPDSPRPEFGHSAAAA